MSKVITIQRQCISSLDEKGDYKIPVLIGSPQELVRRRSLVNKYETNREIKIWATWFILKAFTTSNKIQNWRSQKNLILAFVQMNEKSFYARLKQLVEYKLIEMEDNDIHLVSFEKAADILGIAYTGTYFIHFNPLNYAGKQVFRYLVTAEEFKFQKLRQLNALTYNLDKNPLLKNDLHFLLVKYGADGQQLQKSAAYYQERLLKLQMQMFKEGSDILHYVLTHRADINRGVNRIKENHAYKSTQSASYLKKVMAKLNIITILKKKVESANRARIYIPDGPRKKDGYKYCKRTKQTVWFLTDQISFSYEASNKKTGEGEKRKAA
jgi:hypothetical protein